MARKIERRQSAAKLEQAPEGRIQLGGDAFGAPGEGALAERALESAAAEDESQGAERLAREGVREAERERMLESRRDEEEL